jgi:hypothetical protein
VTPEDHVRDAVGRVENMCDKRIVFRVSRTSACLSRTGNITVDIFVTAGGEQYVQGLCFNEYELSQRLYVERSLLDAVWGSVIQLEAGVHAAQEGEG